MLALSISIGVEEAQMHVRPCMAMPYLEKAKGSIINISSISGLKAVPRSLPYATVKAALIDNTSQGSRASVVSR